MATAESRSVSLMTSSDQEWEDFFASLNREQPNTRAENPEKEQEWDEFVKSLPAYQQHKLWKGEDELILHDDFVGGLRTLDAIRLLLSFESGAEAAEAEQV